MRKSSFGNEKELRTKEVKIRLTESEFNELKNKCGGNMADYLRKNSLSAPPVEMQKIKLSYPKVDPDFVRAINYIGNNLNQLVALHHRNALSKTDIETALIILKIDSFNDAINRLNDNVKNWSRDDS